LNVMLEVVSINVCVELTHAQVLTRGEATHWPGKDSVEARPIEDNCPVAPVLDEFFQQESSEASLADSYKKGTGERGDVRGGVRLEMVPMIDVLSSTLPQTGLNRTLTTWEAWEGCWHREVLEGDGLRVETCSPGERCVKLRKRMQAGPKTLRDRTENLFVGYFKDSRILHESRLLLSAERSTRIVRWSGP
jgi:hypothetical protein